MIFARKINKIPEFYTIFSRKMPECYIIIARKIFFPIFFFGGGACPPCTPTPVSYAYGKTSFISCSNNHCENTSFSRLVRFCEGVI